MRIGPFVSVMVTIIKLIFPDSKDGNLNFNFTFSSISQKIIRKWRDFTILKHPLGVGPGGEKKISLVIYFDYEREYGNAEAKYSADRGFKKIIEILKYFDIKATWNCVGLIAERYPETIERIIEEGHEVSTHTYSHIVPLLTRIDTLALDIDKAKMIFEERFNVRLKGFHSPEDAWSKNLVRILIDRQFSYDIVLEKKRKKVNAHYVSLPKYCFLRTHPMLLRIPSVCDDWMIISKNIPPEKMLAYWLSYFSKSHYGQCFAIGFHPWIIGENDKRTEAFTHFIQSVKENENIITYTGNEIAEWYKTQNGSQP